MSESLVQRYYREAKFGGFTDVDGSIAFHLRVNALLPPEAVVLDVGCGRGSHADDRVPLRRELRDLRSRSARVIGIDPDPAAAANPFIHEFALIDGARWPVPDGSIDLCVADFVLEHVPDPDSFFAECRRVLRPGGYLCIRTSNALSYIGLAARWVPARLQPGILRVAQKDRRSEDVFPTTFRCNTVGRIRRALGRHGFDHCVYGYEAEPSYLSFSRLFYALGVLHERLAPHWVRASIFAFARLMPTARHDTIPQSGQTT